MPENSNENLMSFIEHLKDLRKCLVRTAIGIGLCTSISLYWANEIFYFLTSPIKKNFDAIEIIGTGPAEAFMVKLEVSILAGLLLSSPNIFLQIWLFISPGLYAKEKRIAIPFVLASSFLFLGGSYFCYTMMFPYAFRYFSDEYLSIGIVPNIKIDEYLSFVMRMIIVFGLVFELPVLSFFLARMRLLSHKWLLGNFRYLIVGIFIVAGVLTPPDVVSQLLLAAPLLVIYLLCVIITYLCHPKS